MFASDGRRLRDYSLRAVELLLAISRVVVERNKRGEILCATFRPLSGANPLSKSAHMGQRYSYAQPLADGHYAWRHRELIGERDIEALFGELTEHELESRELFIRAVFRAVPLSILRRPGVKKSTPARVFSIEAGRSRASRRPIEFDSAYHETRAA